MEKRAHRLVLVSGGIPLGGSTTFLLNLAGELVRRDIPVLVVSLEADNPHENDFKQLKIDLHVENDRITIFEDRVHSALERIRSFQPTAVVACLGPSSYEVLRYIPEGVTRLAAIQSDFPENYVPLRQYVRFLDGTLAISREIENKLRSDPLLKGIPSHYLPYGVAVPQQPALRPQNEAVRVLYLGRLCRPQKRVELFPVIFEQLCAANIPFRWSIAGDGPERSWLKDQMCGIAPDRVHFLGKVSYGAVPQILDQHDVLLLPSIAEGLPISVLEAMAHGLVPVISNIRSGVSEIIDSSTGILVDPAKVDGYGRGIIHLAQNPVKRREMSANARQRIINGYSISSMADRWLEMLRLQEMGVGANWPSKFDVHGPLGLSPLRSSQPVRLFRRLVKNCYNFWQALSRRTEMLT